MNYVKIIAQRWRFVNDTANAVYNSTKLFPCMRQFVNFLFKLFTNHDDMWYNNYVCENKNKCFSERPLNTDDIL